MTHSHLSYFIVIDKSCSKRSLFLAELKCKKTISTNKSIVPKILSPVFREPVTKAYRTETELCTFFLSNIWYYRMCCKMSKFLSIVNGNDCKFSIGRHYIDSH